MRVVHRRKYHIIVLIAIVSTLAVLMSIQSNSSPSMQIEFKDRTGQRVLHRPSITMVLEPDARRPTTTLTIPKKQSPNSPCPNLQIPTSVADKQKFQRFSNSTNFVFSAFHDDRNDVIRIIGIFNHLSGIPPVKCQIWFTDVSDVHVTDAVLSAIPETHGLRYSAVQVKCTFPRVHGTPYAVSLVEQKCDIPTNLLSVISTVLPQANRDTFGVCVSPLNGKFNNVHQFVEFMEVNRMFGSRHTVFYNSSVGEKVKTHLESYTRDDLASLVQWSIPVNNKNIHYFGQLAALNDCLYRLSSRVQYIAFVDLDEFVIPRIHQNWSELTNHVNGTGYGIYTFQCTFFKIEYPSDETFSKDPDFAFFHPRTILKMRRENKIFPAGQRSKYIANAKKVDAVGIHNVWTFYAGSREYVIPQSLGLLHHYRFWDTPNDKSWVEDKNMHRFSDQVIKRIKNRFQLMGVTRTP